MAKARPKKSKVAKIKKAKKPKGAKPKIKKIKAKIKSKIKKNVKAKKKSKIKPAPKARLKKKQPAAKKRKRKVHPMAKLLLPLDKVKEIFRTRYGFFLYDGSEFVINNPETPSPWCNIITNGDYGMIISQAGGGMSFKGGIGNRITNWHEDFKGGDFGKFLYIRDNQTQDFWSATWKPVCKQPEYYEVRHGIGYTNITSQTNGIISSIVYYVAADEPVEIWQMRIKNTTDQDRFLSVFSYLEWDFGYPSGTREYDKLFVETSYDEGLSAIFAKTPQSEYAFHSTNHNISTFTCGRDLFVGAYRDVSKPRCVEKGMCFGEQGRYNDPAACFHMDIELPPNGEKELLFTVGKCREKKEAEGLIKKYKNVKVVEEEFSRAGHRWTVRLNNFNIMTPDEGANILSNKWFRYQALSTALSTFGCCHNPRGLVNFKDYLINGLLLLSINPKYYRQLLLDCAERQFENGSVIEEWGPRSFAGTSIGSLEAPLWFVYSVYEYLKETKDTSLLDEDVRFQNAVKENVFEHCVKAIDHAFESVAKRGLPSMLHGDYIKRLDGVSKEDRGESIWLGQFLVYVTSEFLNICELKNNQKLVSDYEAKIKKLKDKIKKVGWDNDRFARCISHTGRTIGLSKGKDARLFLDTQVWAVLSELCDEKQLKEIMDNVRTNLYKDHGPVMLSPAYSEYQEDVGTLSKLPPGVMENGGISLEAACWSIWAETKMGKAHVAWNLYTKLNPVDRSHKSDIYKLEPFVSCEYVDGPEAPTNGFARNSWYNRSSYWMFKVMTEEILGIKPTLEGLLISPCIPNRWRIFKVRRIFRNAYYTIEVLNPRYVSQGIAEITVDGKVVKSNIVPAFGDDKRHHVKVIMGKPKK